MWIRMFPDKPITKKPLSNIDKIRLKLKIQYLIDFNYPDIKTKNKSNDSFDDILKIILKIENHGFFLDPNWFKNLNSDKIRNILYETKLIWNEYNEPFNFKFPYIFNLSKLVSFYNHILDIENISINNKIIIILGGLSYVIKDVKELYPDLTHE